MNGSIHRPQPYKCDKLFMDFLKNSELIPDKWEEPRFVHHCGSMVSKIVYVLYLESNNIKPENIEVWDHDDNTSTHKPITWDMKCGQKQTGKAKKQNTKSKKKDVQLWSKTDTALYRRTFMESMMQTEPPKNNSQAESVLLFASLTRAFKEARRAAIPKKRISLNHHKRMLPKPVVHLVKEKRRAHRRWKQLKAENANKHPDKSPEEIHMVLRGAQ